MAAAPSTSKPGRVRVSLFGIPKSQFAKQLADDLGHLGWNSLHTDLLWGFIYRYGTTMPFARLHAQRSKAWPNACKLMIPVVQARRTPTCRA
jgi:hypothetical protein